MSKRAYTSGRFVLEIDGNRAGFLKKFSGFAMEADIATHDVAVDNIQKKHVSNIKWTPGKATVGIGMGKELYKWIQASFDKGHVYKNGAFIAGDFDYKAQSRLDFQNALITSLTVPKLDGSSKESGYFDVEFDAETVRWAKGGGESLTGEISPKQKDWLCSNFRISIDGLPCKGVASVDSFTWKCSVVTDQVGEFREPTKHPAKVTVPDLKLSISYADYDPWAKAAEDWFVSGNHGEANERTGVIEFLSPNLKNVLGSIDLQNVGFKKFSSDDAEANSEKIKRFNVEMYVEKMKFNLNDAV
jgi:hypothetical protein